MRINLGMSMSNIGVGCDVTYEAFSAISYPTVGSLIIRWSERQNLVEKSGIEESCCDRVNVEIHSTLGC